MASLAAIGFAVIFKVPTRFMSSIALMAFLGFFAREYLLYATNASVELATLFGAIIIGAIGGYLSWRLKVPTQVLTISSAVPMIPGSISFKAIGLLIEFIVAKSPNPDLLTSFVYLSAKALFILGALAFGITVFTMILKPKD